MDVSYVEAEEDDGSAEENEEEEKEAGAEEGEGSAYGKDDVESLEAEEVELAYSTERKRAGRGRPKKQDEGRTAIQHQDANAGKQRSAKR